jgi:hypothetical protein
VDQQQQHELQQLEIERQQLALQAEKQASQAKAEAEAKQHLDQEKATGAKNKLHKNCPDCRARWRHFPCRCWEAGVEKVACGLATGLFLRMMSGLSDSDPVWEVPSSWRL